MPAHGHPLHEALFHFHAEFDAGGLLNRFAVPDLQGRPGTVTNFLGLHVPVSVHPPVLTAMDGTVEPVPDPGNWHADIAEWSAALHAVTAARGQFTVVELGCGWGCWIMNTGLVARRLGLELHLVGIEANAPHLAQAENALALNGFSPGDYRLIHGIAGPRSGKAVFEMTEEGGWGGAAHFDPDAATLRRAETDPALRVLDCYALRDLTGTDGTIDLLHIDIQGAETEFVRGNSDDLAACVRRVLIGTHSRVIEGELIAHFTAAGWRLEMERTAIMPLRGGAQQLVIDGVQMWANPRLA